AIPVLHALVPGAGAGLAGRRGEGAILAFAGRIGGSHRVGLRGDLRLVDLGRLLVGRLARLGGLVFLGEPLLHPAVGRARSLCAASVYVPSLHSPVAPAGAFAHAPVAAASATASGISIRFTFFSSIG